MAKSAPTRRLAREVALQTLFWCDQNDETEETALRDFVHRQLKYRKLERFAWGLIDGVRAHQRDIDQWLDATSHEWSVRRMAPVDRSLLRLAVYELRFAPETERPPPPVVINEALEICKRYSAPQAVPFLNGILDRLAKRDAEEARAAEPDVGGSGDGEPNSWPSNNASSRNGAPELPPGEPSPDTEPPEDEGTEP